MAGKEKLDSPFQNGKGFVDGVVWSEGLKDSPDGSCHTDIEAEFRLG